MEHDEGTNDSSTSKEELRPPRLLSWPPPSAQLTRDLSPSIPVALNLPSTLESLASTLKSLRELCDLTLSPVVDGSVSVTLADSYACAHRCVLMAHMAVDLAASLKASSDRLMEMSNSLQPSSSGD